VCVLLLKVGTKTIYQDFLPVKQIETLCPFLCEHQGKRGHCKKNVINVLCFDFLMNYIVIVQECLGHHQLLIYQRSW